MKSRLGRGLLSFLFSFLVFGLIGYSILYNQFLYPDKEVIRWKETKYYAVEQAVKGFKEMKYDKQVNIKEFNKDNEEALGVLNKITSVINFEVPKVDALNKYGQLYKKPDGSGEKVNSTLSDGDVIKLTVPDFDKIKPTKEELKKLIDFNSDDELYGKKLEGVFLKYLSELKEIPTKVVEFTPEYEQKNNEFVLNQKSLDNLIKLFYEDEAFDSLLKRFAETAIFGEANPDLKYWEDKLKEFPNAKPDDIIGKDTVRSEWLYWNSLKDKEKFKEPTKKLTYFYMNPKFLISTDSKSGNGSFDFKASFDVPMRSYFESDKGVKIPIQITLKESYKGEDAIRFLEKADTRNRGLQSSSKLVFYVVKYELVNLSVNQVISAKGIESFAMSDKNGNLSARTGRMFGIEELSTKKLVIGAGEKKELVYWIAIPDLDAKELAWGANFKDKKDIIWFNKEKGGN